MLPFPFLFCGDSRLDDTAQCPSKRAIILFGKVADFFGQVGVQFGQDIKSFIDGFLKAEAKLRYIPILPAQNSDGCGMSFAFSADHASPFNQDADRLLAFYSICGIKSNDKPNGVYFGFNFGLTKRDFSVFLVSETNEPPRALNSSAAPRIELEGVQHAQ